MLDKGKGPIIKKLRVIQLMEADLQLIMWIFLGQRNIGRIENDLRLSKFNYSSRKGNSIDEIILEKRLLYNVSIRDCNEMIHIITDLESCYDRQLANLVSMVEESVGIDRNGVKLIAKVLPVLQYHVYTRFGISKD